MTVALLVAAWALVAGFVWHVSRPRILVELSGGRATVLRGQLMPAALGDLRDVARSAPQAQGKVAIRGRQATLRLSFSGLDAGTEQRLRNVLLLRRDRL